MQRSLNYTNRKKIKRDSVRITLNRNGTDFPSFDATLSLDGLDLAPDSAIYIEAYRGNTQQRFAFGTAARIEPPSNRAISEVDLTGPTLFRVKVIDESGEAGRLLASAQELRPVNEDEDDNRASLLAVRTRDLGEKSWHLIFDADGRIELCLNSKIPNAISRIRNDRTFQALVLPAAVREILVYLLWNEADADESEHVRRWFAFAEEICEPPPAENDPSALLEWVESVVGEFCQKFSFTEKLRQHLNEGSL